MQVFKRGLVEACALIELATMWIMFEMCGAFQNLQHSGGKEKAHYGSRFRPLPSQQVALDISGIRDSPIQWEDQHAGKDVDGRSGCDGAEARRIPEW
jgi:hypothetical protein